MRERQPLSDEEIFQGTITALEKQSPALAEILKSLSQKEKEELDLILNLEGLYWTVFKGIEQENKETVREILEKWRTETDENVKKELGKQLTDLL